MSASSIADSYNRDLIEEAYAKWRIAPSSVDSTWAAFFTGVEFADGVAHSEPRTTTPSSNDSRLQIGVLLLIQRYRQAGHLLDPLRSQPTSPIDQLRLEEFDLSETDLDTIVDGSMFHGIEGLARLGDLQDALRSTYCGSIGVEFMHIDDRERLEWLTNRMESTRNRPTLDLRDKYRILMTLHWAALFENYLQTKYVGRKRFSLEGAETLLPMLDAIVERASTLGIKEIVVGMSHRGRLNVLANLLGKPLEQIFSEFEDRYIPEAGLDGDGDVKYHLGFSSDIRTSKGSKVHVSLNPNPSHLEAVAPVVEGRVRAKQQIFGDKERATGMPLLIHGDAAFAGQGVVAETLNLSGLEGYRTGGTVHIVVNNQIGFTTVPRDARSTRYCTDIAKLIQAPIFHVNGDSPEAAVHVAQLALEYRQQFKSSVVIDLFCWRKFGHSEGDDPSYTSPVMVRLIQAKEPVPTVYTKALVAESAIKSEEAKAIDDEFRRKLDAALAEVKAGQAKVKVDSGLTGKWSTMSREYVDVVAETQISEASADQIAEGLTRVPDGFIVHPKIKKQIDKRREDILSRKSLDWGAAEALAFGSLVLERVPVRLSGQDTRRGTFSHRHSFYFDHETGREFCPLAHLDPAQAMFEAIDSPLSELAALGFEYGYSLEDPGVLVIWEAQFGDFANGAQTIIDQFIASGESKWNRASGIVLLLPHGHEGQGPEHSSARPERFLQACAKDNMQVCNFTTPAQYFHALRRQVKRPFRKPLIIMTPKSLLRHPKAVSPFAEFTAGQFHEVLDDDVISAENVRRVVLCSGKLYYDLLAKRESLGRADTAIVRIEQLYPWPEDRLKKILARYRRATEWIWAQEEPHNMGGWFFIEPRLRAIGLSVLYVGRDAASSPAAGSLGVHESEQGELVGAALTKPAANFVSVIVRKA